MSKQEPLELGDFCQKWWLGVIDSMEGEGREVVSECWGGKCGMEMLSKAVGTSFELSKRSWRSSGVIGGMCSLERKSHREFWELLSVYR